MGSPDMATRPTITMRIEITMATMGRLMKNLAMAGYSFLAAGAEAAFVADEGDVSEPGLSSAATSFGVTIWPSRTF